jgi:4-alpha-glucanotransferase
VDRSTSRSRAKLVAVVAVGTDGLRQLSVSIPVILRRQRTSDQPDWLIDDGLLSANDRTPPSFPETTVDYSVVFPFKRGLLEKAWTNFRTGVPAELKFAFEQFSNDQAHWLDDYSLFRVLKARYNGAYYLEWPEELVKRVPAALDQARRVLASQIDQVRFAQFLLFRQADRLRRHANAKGIHLIGDLPFFVSPDSSDVWANPELFMLDEQQKPRFVAGVPPDYFSTQGQLWGNPVYNWVR